MGRLLMKKQYYYVRFYDDEDRLREEYICAFGVNEIPARLALEWPGARIVKIVKSETLQAMIDLIPGEVI